MIVYTVETLISLEFSIDFNVYFHSLHITQSFVYERILHCTARNVVAFRGLTTILATILVNVLKDCACLKTFRKVLTHPHKIYKRVRK